MKRAISIAAGTVGAIVFAAGGYAAGAARGTGSAELSVQCEPAKETFTRLAGQVRKQLQPEADTDNRSTSIEEARVKILTATVTQNPACFDAGIRAEATVLTHNLPEGQRDAAVCELIDLRSPCFVAVS
ncbi:hypothetical protein ACWDA7_19855 [Streptomyces sp. NPDC001156]